MASIAFLILLLMWNLAPLLLVGWARYALVGRKAWRAGTRRDVGVGLILSGIGTSCFVFFMMASIVSIGDAQAPLGFLFTPTLTWPLAILTFGVGWSTSVLIGYFQVSWRTSETPSGVGHGRPVGGAVCVLIMSMTIVGGMYHHLSRYGKAESIATSADDLRKLYTQASEKHDYHMLMRLAQNPSCPPDVLRELSTSQNIAVRYRAVRNPCLPVDLFEPLSAHDDPHSRGFLTSNPSIPKEILKKLATDSDEMVRLGANYRLNGGTPPQPRKLGTLNNILDLLLD